jgi:hypothetical protein
VLYFDRCLRGPDGLYSKQTAAADHLDSASVYTQLNHVFSANLRLKQREAGQAFLGSRSGDTFRGLFEALYPKLVGYFSVRGLDLQVAKNWPRTS